MGVHLALHAGVHERQPGLSGANPGDPSFEGELACWHQTSARQPGAYRRGRRFRGDVRQSVLRADERPHLVTAGDATAMDGHRGDRRHPRHRNRLLRTKHPGGATRVVRRPTVLQRDARVARGCASGPDPSCSTRHRCRGARHLPADRGGQRHLYREALHRTPDRHIPCPVRDRGILHPAVRSCVEGSAPCKGEQTGVVNAGIREYLLCETEDEP